MASTTATFPRIKEIRTFLIDGVGSGGDYHNVCFLVLHPFYSLKTSRVHGVQCAMLIPSFTRSKAATG